MGSDVHLGRLTLPAAIAPADELGDGLEAVGAVLVGAERRPRPLELSLALRGTASDADPKTAGDRLRRQLTGLLENARARLEGMWLTFDADPLLDSYVLVGGGKLAVGDHSLVLGDYELELSDVYRVGKATTHRDARRIDVRDLTTGTTPRDIRRTRYSTDFAGTPPSVTQGAPLPPGLLDATMGDTGLVSFPNGQTIRGNAQNGYQAGAPVIDGSVYSYEIADSDRRAGTGDVIAWDTRNAPTPAFTAAGDRDPRTYGWEEAYGPAHPFLTVAPRLVLENGLCRVRTDDVGAAFSVIIERYPGLAPGYVESARVTATNPANAADFELSASLLEWTPDRAVVRFRRTFGSGRLEVYVILQRGWLGPQIEMYGPMPGMRAVLPSAAAASLDSASTSTQTVGNAVAIAPTDPWLVLGAVANTGNGVLVAPLENHPATLVSDTAAYAAARPAVNLASLGGHVGARFGIVPLDGNDFARASEQAADTMHPIRTTATLVAR